MSLTSLLKPAALMAGLMAQGDRAPALPSLESALLPARDRSEELFAATPDSQFVIPKVSEEVLAAGVLPDSTLKRIGVETLQAVFGDSLDYSAAWSWTTSFSGDTVPPATAEEFSLRIKDLLDNYSVVPVIALRHADYQSPNSAALEQAWDKIATGLSRINPERIFPASILIALPPDDGKLQVVLHCVAVGVQTNLESQSAIPAVPQSIPGAPAQQEATLPPCTEWGGPFVGPGYIKLSNDRELVGVCFGGIGPIWGRLALNAGIGGLTELGSKGVQQEISGVYAEAGPSLRVLWRFHAEAGLSAMGLMGPSAYGSYYGLHFYPDGPGPSFFLRLNSYRIIGEEGASASRPAHSEHGMQVGLQWTFGRSE